MNEKGPADYDTLVKEEVMLERKLFIFKIVLI